MPASASASTRPSSPTTNADRTSRDASRVAVARAEVTTSTSATSTPTDASRSATSAGVRLALFVTNASPLPAARSCSTASGAPAIGSGHRYRTPSRSRRIASYGSASTSGGEPLGGPHVVRDVRAQHDGELGVPAGPRSLARALAREREREVRVVVRRVQLHRLRELATRARRPAARVERAAERLADRRFLGLE